MKVPFRDPQVPHFVLKSTFSDSVLTGLWIRYVRYVHWPSHHSSIVKGRIISIRPGEEKATGHFWNVATRDVLKMPYPERKQWLENVTNDPVSGVVMWVATEKATIDEVDFNSYITIR